MCMDVLFMSFQTHSLVTLMIECIFFCSEQVMGQLFFLLLTFIFYHAQGLTIESKM